MTQTLSASFVLCQRELIRFVRQRNRVIGSLVTPLVFWVFIGFGMGHSFAGTPGATPGQAQEGYTTYFFPGTILLSLLFTAIFSTISIIEDRREGFLQGVLVAPVGRLAIVGGKVLGGAVMATGQGVIILLGGWIFGVIHLSPVLFFASTVVMFVVSMGLTGLGLFAAWQMTSTQGFHVIMNLVFMPMWLLSGALFPIRDDTPRLFAAVMLVNPLTYALASLRRVMGDGSDQSWPVWPSRLNGLPVAFAVTVIATIIMVAAAAWIAQGRSAADAA